MTKIKQENITKEDINEYLDKYSDFSFEIKVLNKFSKSGFFCTHSGTYMDPLTNKYREFDIRAKKSLNNKRLYFAIECKNLNPYFPLVAHCTRRNKKESFHEVLRHQPKAEGSEIIYLSFADRHSSHNSIYQPDEYVAKSFDQVGRHISMNSIVSNDSDTFEKLSQAINSTYDLIINAKDEKTDIPIYCFIHPLLIIPDNTLWTVYYDNEGNKTQEPELTKYISYFIDRYWLVDKERNSKYSLSHMSIVTYSHLDKYLNKFFNDEDDWEEIFSVV